MAWEEWERTHRCGTLRPEHDGQRVTVMGWVDTARNHGGVLFIDLRDREGAVQVVFDPQTHPDAFEIVQPVRNEFVLAVKGLVRLRPDGTANPSLPTGDVEIVASKVEILNECPTLPFQVNNDSENVGEDLRLKYRYLDLRRPRIQKNLMLRHRLYQVVRNFLDAEGFVEVETPILTKSTPEGARDYLVPSRTVPGMFFALPQSPQLFKQLLMVAGYDRYFQIVRCFRDEDLRAHRQPEFTQIDLEMAFVHREDVLNLNERLCQVMYQKILGKEVSIPFERLSYDEAMTRWGSDKPDRRFGLELADCASFVKDSGFQVFSRAIAEGGSVMGLRVPAENALNRSELDKLTEQAKAFGAKGLVWLRCEGAELKGPSAKFLSQTEQEGLRAGLGLENDDVALIVADSWQKSRDVLGKLRLLLGEKFELIDKDALDIHWVLDFPLFEWDAEEGRWVALHHPFTSPKDEDLPFLDTDPGKIKAKAYDLVINGVEVGGGSIRIHRRDIQSKVFSLLGLSDEEAKAKFSFLLEALQFGAPPHGGFAWGFDRFAMLLAGIDSIREIIAFPKTLKATCLLTNAPSEVDAKQLRELSIKLDVKKG